jgi:dienelactone hydrolase
MATVLAEPRSFPERQQPDDRRLGDLKAYDSYFPFDPSTSVDAWHRRAEEVRRQVLVSQGLWPLPRKTPTNAVVHGRVDRDDYTVDRVYIESYPGHFVTGSLYRPKGRSGRLPGVLCPHGHWPNGRFMTTEAKAFEKQLETGAEHFEKGGRTPLQARCVQLARMGCVVFLYDMLGYADSQQLEHRPGVRESMNTPENWGFFSPQAELRLQTMMGVQTYNSIRALDWLCDLPDVDPTRIGVTGASGGGTQTLVLAAVDPRVTVEFPAVMVSTAMQGGCTCENACYLRVNTGNVEIVGTFAPKPAGMTGANDWTKEIETKGYPQLQQLYELLGAKDNVLAKALVQFPHNYNAVSRAVMYTWFNKHLKLEIAEPIVERDYEPLTTEEMTVWDDAHPKPPAGDDYERSLVRQMTDDSDAQISALAPRDFDSFDKFSDVVGRAWQTMIGRSLPEADAIEHEKIEEFDRGDYLEFASVLRNSKLGESLPAIFFLPKNWNERVVIWAHGKGKNALYGDDGSPTRAVRRLIDAGFSVAAIDCFGTGEFSADGQEVSTQRTLKGPKHGAIADYAGYTFGYNDSLFAQRVHDLLSVISFVRHHKRQSEAVYLVALGGAGPWAAAARAIAGSSVDRAAIDTQGFRFAKLTAMNDPNFVPGSVKYGDLPALLALSAPYDLWLAGEGSAGPAIVSGTYKALEHESSLVLNDEPAEFSADAAVDWLLQDPE